MTGPEILVIGEALIDIVHDQDGRTTERVGGSPLNVAVGLGRLGHPVQLLTTLGSDERGDAVRAHLHDSGVTALETATSSGTTSTATAEITADGSARYIFDIDWAPAVPGAAPLAAIVHTGSLGAALAPGADVVLDFISRVRDDALISFDPNIRAALMRPHAEQIEWTERFFALSDVVKLSDEDAEWLYPGVNLDEVIDRILALGPHVVAVTRGGDGAVLRTRRNRVEQEADVGGIVDTIGAGDSFMAGLLHGLAGIVDAEPSPSLRRSDVIGADALQLLGATARACAAITVRRPGADLPWAAELRRAEALG